MFVDRLGAKALNNEFFTKACIDWRKRLANGLSITSYEIAFSRQLDSTHSCRNELVCSPWGRD